MVFRNRIALITGAGGLIGSETAKAFARAGVTVAVTDARSAAAEEVAAAIGVEGLKAKAFVLDLLDGASVRSAVDAILAEFGRVDILVNNAGAWDHGGVRGAMRFETIREEHWTRTLRLNVEGTMRVTQAVLPHMLERGYGRIVNLGSIAGITGIPGNCDYSASKGALGVFTRTLAMETAKRGVTVNSVAPGWIEGTSRPIDRTWIGRCGEPKDIARAILFFADDEAGYITGTELPVDGGRILGSHGDDM